MDETNSTESELIIEDGGYVLHGNMKVDGNLEVSSQLTATGLKILDDEQKPMVQTTNTTVSFKKAVEFLKPVQFNNGRTIIGTETTYNSAYVGTQTIQAGERIVVGDSSMKIDANTRKIIADTYNMTLRSLESDTITSLKETSNLIETKKMKVTDELISNKIYADTIRTNNLYIESIKSRGIESYGDMTTKDLIVGGSAKIQNGITIMGIGVNGAALTVNGGEIVANKGIVSHTRNNRFQTLQIMGSGTTNDICFRIDKGVDSYIEGDVTIHDSKLILDNSQLATDEIIVTDLEQVASSEAVSGIRITSKDDWDDQTASMVQELDPSNDTFTADDDYDPYAAVQAAMDRNALNYQLAEARMKSLTSPISYMMEQSDSDVPKKFKVKPGVCRIGSDGKALLRNVTSENGKFSDLEAYRFKANQFKVDKLVVTSVASNVVDTDNLLKSRGIAEFDGVVNSSADIFIEKDSKVNVAKDAQVTFQSGSSLVLKSGCRFEMGTDTTVKMGGDIELDIHRLVFVDSSTGRRYRIVFRDGSLCEGGGVVMEYQRVEDSEQSSSRIVESTKMDARELDNKLKQLGI